MELYTPAQLEALTGLAVANQSAWRTSGLMNGRGQQTKGGHWRFTKRDVLYVAAVRVLGEKAPLDAAAFLAESCLLEIEGKITGNPVISSTPGHYGFVWKRDDCTPEAEAGLSEALFRFERWIENDAFPDALTLHHSGDWCATVMDDLNFVPRLSRSGGTIEILSDLPRRIPPAVSDLFKAGAAK